MIAMIRSFTKLSCIQLNMPPSLAGFIEGTSAPKFKSPVIVEVPYLVLKI